MTRNFLACALLCLTPALALGLAGAFQAKPIRIMMPFAAGSGADSNSRFYGDLLARLFGQPVLVENRSGASGVLAVQAIKAAPADG